MINNLNNTDCCTTPTNLVEIMEHTHIKGAGLYQCRVCHHADFYPQELFKEDAAKKGGIQHKIQHKKAIEVVEGK